MPGYPNLTTPSSDDAMKASAFVKDALIDPATSHSEEPSEAPCLRLFKTKGYLEYVYGPGNEYLQARFGAAMGTFAAAESETVVPGGFPWEELPEGTKIVDVGGGIGSASHEIIKKNPLLKFTVQDLPNVAEQATAVSDPDIADTRGHLLTIYAQYWDNHEPNAIADGQVTIQAHDFFTPQPIKDADVFLLRYVLHDWSNTKAIEILEQLREAAVPGKTKVVVIDGVLQYACEIDRKKIPGAENIVFEGSDKKSEVPVGLLANLGKAQARNYRTDLTYGLPTSPIARFTTFLTNLQDVGEGQWARAHAGGPYSSDGGQWVEDSEDIFSGRKEN